MAAELKRILLKRCNAFQVTGELQRKYINFFYPESNEKPHIVLPNIIDEDLFVHELDKLRKETFSLRGNLGIDDNTQMWIIPARLSPEKGIVEFLKALGKVKGIEVVLIGDGPLGPQIDSLIQTEELPVTRVGFLQQEEIVKYYAVADLFVLPSYQDASPLTTIEAIAAGLPLLISNKIGNKSEVLMGENGWSFDPGNVVSIKEVVSKVITMRRDELAEIGKYSRKIYKEFFDSKFCIESFAKQLKGLAVKNE